MHILRTTAIVLCTALLVACTSEPDRRVPDLPSQQPYPPLGSRGSFPADTVGVAPGSQVPPGLPGDPPPGAPVAGGGGACNAAAAQSVVGRLANISATEEAKTLSGAQTVRVLYPNQPITQEFIGTRLNLETDDANNVVRVRCG